jgi:hypothetical protein
LTRALASIRAQRQAGDVTLVVGGPHCQTTALAMGCDFLEAPPGGDWGGQERNAALAQPLTTDYVAFLDDDDIAAPGARQAIASALTDHPGSPLIGRMAYASGLVLWQSTELTCGNVGSPMFVVPADPARLGRWTPRYEGDYDFITSCGWPVDEFFWLRDVLALVRPS